MFWDLAINIVLVILFFGVYLQILKGEEFSHIPGFERLRNFSIVAVVACILYVGYDFWNVWSEGRGPLAALFDTSSPDRNRKYFYIWDSLLFFHSYVHWPLEMVNEFFSRLSELGFGLWTISLLVGTPFIVALVFFSVHLASEPEGERHWSSYVLQAYVNVLFGVLSLGAAFYVASFLVIVGGTSAINIGVYVIIVVGSIAFLGFLANGSRVGIGFRMR